GQALRQALILLERLLDAGALSALEFAVQVGRQQLIRNFHCGIPRRSPEALGGAPAGHVSPAREADDPRPPPAGQLPRTEEACPGMNRSRSLIESGSRLSRGESTGGWHFVRSAAEWWVLLRLGSRRLDGAQDRPSGPLRNAQRAPGGARVH